LAYLLSFKLLYHYNSVFDLPCCHDLSFLLSSSIVKTLD
jgi:hypothetical protein